MLQETILQYFWPSLSYHLSLRPLFCPFLSGRLRQEVGTDRPDETGEIQISLLLKEQSDQDLHWLPFRNIIFHITSGYYTNLLQFENKNGMTLIKAPKCLG